MSRNIEFDSHRTTPAARAGPEDTTGPLDSSAASDSSGTRGSPDAGSAGDSEDSRAVDPMATCDFDPSATVGSISGGTERRGSAGRTDNSDNAAEPDPELQWIGDFRVEAELGRGAFGVVYQARDPKLDRRVAIKRPLMLDRKLRDQYIREARLAAQLDCQGIVPIYYVGTMEDGSPFVVQKLIDGPSLRSLVRRNGRLPAVHAARLVAEVARAVAVAHRQGMVHRDLKPDNILIDSTGRPWVADFGLALQDVDQRGRRGEIAGTLPYMAPEQIQGRADWLDGRADIWALGIILYELLSGERPFQGSDSAELSDEIQHRDPRPIHQRRQDLPPELDRVVQRACHKKPVDRYQTADEMAEELEGLLESGLLPPPTESEFPAQIGGVSSGSTFLSTGRRSRLSSASTLPLPQSQQSGIPVWWSAIPLIVAVVLLGLAFWIVAERRDRDRGPEPAVAELQSHGADSAPTAVIEADEKVSRRERAGPPELSSDQRATETGPGTALAADAARQLADAAAPPDAPAAGTSAAEPQASGGAAVAAHEPPLPRPLTVSADGDGSFRTIAEAVDYAEPNERILIRGGVYNEQLLLHKSVQLWAQSPFAEIEIVGATGPAIEVEGADVTLHGIALRNTSGGDQPFNTVEVRDGGRLTLENCDVTADSYCCVRAMSAASFEATGCTFRAKTNSAVVSIDTRQLKITGCFFRLSKKTAVEIFGGGAVLADCEFWSGPQQPAGHQVGLYCERSEEGLVDVRQCTFRGCTAGAINLVHGARAAITDCRITDSRHGIFVSHSELRASNTRIEDCEDQALRLEANREAVIDNCQLLRCQVGIKLTGGEANVTNSTIANNEQLGVDVSENSTLDLRYSRVAENSAAGLLSQESTVVVTGGTFTGSDDQQRRGIFAREGALDVHDVDVSNHDEVGIAFVGTRGSVQGGRLTGNALGVAVNASTSRTAAAEQGAPEERAVRIAGLQISEIGAVGIYFGPATRGSVVDCFTEDPSGKPACVAGADAEVELKGCNFGLVERS